MTSERSEIEALAPSCGPAAALDSATLLTVLVECAGRSALHGTEILHARVIECREELARRLSAPAVPEGFVLVHQKPAMYQQIHRHHSDAKWEECDKATFDQYVTYHARYGGVPPVRALYAAAPAPDRPAPESPEARRPAPDMSKSWPERDYMCVCSQCGASFIGYKLQAVCKACSPEPGTYWRDPRTGRLWSEVDVRFEGKNTIDWERVVVGGKPEAGQREGVEALSIDDLAMEWLGKARDVERSAAGQDQAAVNWSVVHATQITLRLCAADLRRLASAQQAGTSLGISFIADKNVPPDEVRVMQDGKPVALIVGTGSRGEASDE